MIGAQGVALTQSRKVNLIFIFVPIEKFGIKVPDADWVREPRPGSRLASDVSGVERQLRLRKPQSHASALRLP